MVFLTRTCFNNAGKPVEEVYAIISFIIANGIINVLLNRGHISIADTERVEGGVCVEFRHIVGFQPQVVLFTDEELSVDGAVFEKEVVLSPDHLNAPKNPSL